MYTRKFQQCVLQSKHNLQKVSPCQYSSLPDFKLAEALKNVGGLPEAALRSVRLTLKTLLKGKSAGTISDERLVGCLRLAALAIPRSLREHSSKILRVWAHQCECVVAQRLRRTQQMFSLYSRLWEERALNAFLHNVRRQLEHQSKRFILAATGVSVFNWEANRLKDEELLRYVTEFEYVDLLKKKTIVCIECKNKEICSCSNEKDNLTYDNWSLFIKRDDLLVWRKPAVGGFEYKVFGIYNDVTAEDFLNVQVDIVYRQHWDETAVKLVQVETDVDKRSNCDIVYWEMLWPRLFSNRDYVFQRRYLVDRKTRTVLLLNKSTEHPHYPPKSDKFRIKDYWSYMVIKPETDYRTPGIRFVLTYYDNPGVNIPSAITTWVAMRAMPDFVTNLRAAAKKYKDYCEREKHPCICSIFLDTECEEEEKMEDTNLEVKEMPGAPGFEVMTTPNPMKRHEGEKWQLHSFFS